MAIMNIWSSSLVISLLVYVIILCSNIYEVKSSCVDHMLTFFNDDITNESNTKIELESSSISDGTSITFKSINNNEKREETSVFPNPILPVIVNSEPLFKQDTPAKKFLNALFNKINKKYLFGLSYGYDTDVEVTFSSKHSLDVLIAEEPLSNFGYYVKYILRTIAIRNQSYADISIPKDFASAIHKAYSNKKYKECFGNVDIVSSEECMNHLMSVKLPYNQELNLYDQNDVMEIIYLMLYHWTELDLKDNPCAKMYHCYIRLNSVFHLNKHTSSPVKWCSHSIIFHDISLLE